MDVHRRVEFGGEPRKRADVVRVGVGQQHPIDRSEWVAGVLDATSDGPLVTRPASVDERQRPVVDEEDVRPIERPAVDVPEPVHDLIHHSSRLRLTDV